MQTGRLHRAILAASMAKIARPAVLASASCVLSFHTVGTLCLDSSQGPRLASCDGIISISCRSVAIVSLNGSILGVHRAPEKLVRGFRAARRAGGIGGFVSVYRQAGAVHIASDGGRVCRPLIVCEGGAPKVTAEHTAKVGVNSVVCPAVSGAAQLGASCLNPCRDASPAAVDAHVLLDRRCAAAAEAGHLGL